MIFADINFGTSDPLWFVVGTCAIAVALAAWWVAVQESRRNNSAMLRLLKCTYMGCQAIGENNNQLFHRFELVVRNRGISLYDVVVSIGFCGSDGRGRLTMVVPRDSRTRDKAAEPIEFARGMTGTFALTSYLLNDGDVGFLSDLKDARQQDAWIQVFSHGYHAYSFRIGGMRDRLSARWNTIAARINAVFSRRRGTTADGIPLIQTHEPLPSSVTIAPAIAHFIRALKKRHDAGTQGGRN